MSIGDLPPFHEQVSNSIAGAIQKSLGVGPEELIPLTKDDTKGAAYLFTGTATLGPDANDFNREAALESLGSVGYDSALGLAIRSEQTKVSRNHRGLFARAADLVAPSYDVEALVDIYYDDADYRAVVDTRAILTAGLGVEIRPRMNIEDPDQEQRDRLQALLDFPCEDMSTSDTLVATCRDCLSTGTGYLEVGRNAYAALDQSLEGFKYAPSLVTRIALNGKEYYQLHGKTVKVFRKLGARDGTPNALVAKTRKTLPDGMCNAIAWLTLEETKEYRKGNLSLASSTNTITRVDETIIDKTTRVVAATEIMQFNRPAANDSYYGVPEIISAIRDYVASRYIRIMNNNFFDNNTIPPLLVVVTGENLGRDDRENIKAAILRNRGSSAFHKAAYVELPMGAELKIEPLTQFIPQKAGFLDYLDHSATSIHKAYRTPRSMTEVMKGVGSGVVEEADRRFVETVIAPDQRMFEYKLNWMFRRYLGITDWEISLKVLDLEDKAKQAQIDDIYMRRAVYSPNDVLARLGMPPKEGGEHSTLIVPGVGVLLLEAVRVLSERVLAGERLRDVILPRGTKTPSKAVPAVEPAETVEGEAELFDPSEVNESIARQVIMMGLGKAINDLMRS